MQLPLNGNPLSLIAQAQQSQMRLVATYEKQHH